MDEIVVGTYEGFLLGYSVIFEDGVNKFKQTFATQSHTASVRCISMAGKFLASGGTDDKVVVIDMKTRKEHTVLMNHDGTINTVTFTNGGTHLLSGSDDGKIIVTRTGNWQIEKIWKKAHGGQPVIAISVHPTDKLALSIGGDKTLRTWNLVKGRPAFTINLASKGVILPTQVMFAPGGDRFSLLSQQNLEVWTISKAGMEKRVTCSARPSSVRWVSDEKLYVGLDNGNIISLSMSNSEANTYPVHKHRVKCLFSQGHNLYTASSAGEIKVWSDIDSKLHEVCSVNASCRITCMVLNKQSDVIKKEEKSEEDEVNESVEDNHDPENIEKSDDDEMIEKNTLKRKPGAFVIIQYDGDNNGETGTTPPNKKSKKKKNRNKNKNKV